MSGGIKAFSSQLKNMGEAKQVKLYGTWASGFCAMVHSALKLKGVDYEYAEEDLADKSESLLRLNPVHKKVPVLVVDGKPVVESLVILEFVDETWTNEPALLPKDAYLRAKTRFWADFIYQKLNPISYAIIRSKGEAQLEEAKKEVTEHLLTLEEGISKDFSSKGPFVNGEVPGLLDIILGSCSSGLKVLGNIAGFELLEKTPLLYSAVNAFADYEVTKDTMIPYDKLLERIQAMRAAT